MSRQPISKDSLRSHAIETIEAEPVFSLPRLRVNSGFDLRLADTRARLQARVICGLVTLAFWAHAATVFAQGRGQPAPAAPAEKSYILPYVIVVLCIALGLLVVCRSGGRSNEPKVEDLEK